MYYLYVDNTPSFYKSIERIIYLCTHTNPGDSSHIKKIHRASLNGAHTQCALTPLHARDKGRQKTNMNFLMDSSRLAARVTDMDTFYEKAADVFKWGSLENSTVLDIGCGLGLSSTKFLKLFPGIQKIIAIDKDMDTVLEARDLFPDDKIEFHYGNIELGFVFYLHS
ncbi:hypothetical protein TNIN_151551 [Trichonephila inaurata madagascariensis]|uniref:Methyltransferase domain-containing protein n=1 Tax=Trichonephila inaurata madagascariensis TaxID=2747483 RepID=A0A8X6XZX4_9ARAC|nr:hypothetical protein TNIN_151551 [Trichonephila inaurata madagascariensis]